MFVALFVEFHCIIILILNQTHTHTISSCTFRMLESFLIPSNGMCLAQKRGQKQHKYSPMAPLFTHIIKKKNIWRERERRKRLKLSAFDDIVPWEKTRFGRESHECLYRHRTHGMRIHSKLNWIELKLDVPFIWIFVWMRFNGGIGKPTNTLHTIDVMCIHIASFVVRLWLFHHSPGSTAFH